MGGFFFILEFSRRSLLLDTRGRFIILVKWLVFFFFWTVLAHLLLWTRFILFNTCERSLILEISGRYFIKDSDSRYLLLDSCGRFMLLDARGLSFGFYFGYQADIWFRAQMADFLFWTLVTVFLFWDTSDRFYFRHWWPTLNSSGRFLILGRH